MELDKLPLTYYFEWESCDERTRRATMAEFAANGAKHLVLTDVLLKMLCGTPALYRKLAAELADAGLSFVDAHAPFRDECDLWLPVPEYRRQMLARRKFELQLVRDFGVDTCTIHVGNWPYPGHTLDEYRDAVRRSLEELVPVAEKLGVTICLENLYKPLNLPDAIVGFITEFRSDRLGACFDAGQPGSLPVRAIDARTVATVSRSNGFMIGMSSPPMNAIARKLRFRVPRSGRPNDTLERPIVVSTPSFLSAESVSIVILPYWGFDDMAITSPSKTSRRRSMPMLSALSIMRLAISIRP